LHQSRLRGRCDLKGAKKTHTKQGVWTEKPSKLNKETITKRNGKPSRSKRTQITSTDCIPRDTRCYLKRALSGVRERSGRRGRGRAITTRKEVRWGREPQTKPDFKKIKQKLVCSKEKRGL